MTRAIKVDMVLWFS